MAALERQARAPQGFVPASSGPEGGNIPQKEAGSVEANPDALDIELDDD
jgi:pre-mRNA-splicing factor SYF1